MGKRRCKQKHDAPFFSYFSDENWLMEQEACWSMEQMEQNVLQEIEKYKKKGEPVFVADLSKDHNLVCFDRKKNVMTTRVAQRNAALMAMITENVTVEKHTPSGPEASITGDVSTNRLRLC
ncbi:unnamed protein product [Gongylonema pulchrum]|uniref:PHM7_ext domain-containing protein n=1 Tax=Gongylonema pulchrum TaxID=637853 RepID=A0A183CVF0_9BILA|nr:unnamed protein product [Gongylonema pulchrum]